MTENSTINVTFIIATIILCATALVIVAMMKGQDGFIFAGVIGLFGIIVGHLAKSKNKKCGD